MSDPLKLVETLERTHSLSLAEYEALLRQRSEALSAELRARAVRVRKAVYGNTVFTRGLIEISSFCKND